MIIFDDETIDGTTDDEGKNTSITTEALKTARSRQAYSPAKADVVLATLDHRRKETTRSKLGVKSLDIDAKKPRLTGTGLSACGISVLTTCANHDSVHLKKSRNIVKKLILAASIAALLATRAYAQDISGLIRAIGGQVNHQRQVNNKSETIAKYKAEQQAREAERQANEAAKAEELAALNEKLAQYKTKGWMYATDNSNKDTFYVSGEDIRVKNQIMTVWVKTSFGKPHKLMNKTANSSITLVEYDCENRRYTDQKTNLYKGKSGDLAMVISSDDFDYNPQTNHVIPDTAGSRLLNFVCALK